MSPFGDSMRHWYGIRDAGNIIQPKKNQAQYTEAEITKIADNILLFQRNNGGWPKNYDMQAILLPEQIDSIIQTKVQTNTTFDNSTTYTHIEYLANVYAQTHTEKYRVACLKGLEFVLSAQFKNGGWPQYFPLEKGDYSRHITFNDGAYMGIMNLLQNIVDNHPDFSFVDTKLRKRIAVAYQKGLDCILKMQIVDQEKLTVWCQQHDEVTLQPAWARAFEPPAICNGESAGIVLFLMSIDRPDARIIQAVQSAVKWFNDSKIQNTRVETIDAPTEKSQYQTYSVDKVVVNDPKAPPIWTRYYELNTERPLFSDRNKKFLYSMAEVSRERRVGYAWYTYAPQSVLNKYPEWQKKWAPEKNILNVQVIPRDTSFTPYQAWIKIKKEFPQAQIVKPSLPVGVVADMNIIYATLSETPYGKRDLHFDLFRPEKSGKYPALLLVHGGGWRSGNKSMQVPMAQQIAAKGYVTASVEYRLSPEALYPAAVHDIKAAIRFLRANASKYNIDPDKIAITGSSAGGQLAALIGATSGVEKFEGNGGNPGVSSAVQAIIDMDGVLDFDTPDEKGKDEETAKRSAGALWFGTTFNQNSEKWIEASPIHYVGKNTPPMLFINSALPRFHYGRDSVIAILDKHKIYSEVHTIENTPHPFWLFHPWFEPTVKYMVDFLDKVMK
jgi:PelA/Pel-15E family pectate lyase